MGLWRETIVATWTHLLVSPYNVCQAVSSVTMNTAGPLVHPRDWWQWGEKWEETEVHVCIKY